MKFLETMAKLKAFFDLFKKSSAPAEEKKGKKIAVGLSLALTGIALVVGIALLIRKLKQRRLEKEAKEALDDYYATDFDADEYAEDEEDY
ncbi:MAG: hypothetical protein J6B86_06000 [Clostridia bacterium]|nr:hypothetical protein [Clostridia bacterium]